MHINGCQWSPLDAMDANTASLQDQRGNLEINARTTLEIVLSAILA